MSLARVSDSRIEAAYATVPREKFLGPGPWRLATEEGEYFETPSDDPAHLYADTVVSILPERGLNNGQPSFHLKLMAHASPQPGEHVVHVGAGVGYYSALLGELVASSGRVTAIEFDGELANRARRNLAAWSNIDLVQGDGTTTRFDKADVIYVSAGTTRPADKWLDQLAEGGRLVLPLTVAEQRENADPGAVFLITRRGDDYCARWLSMVAIFPCQSGRDDVSERALAQALRSGRAGEVTRLYRSTMPDDRCWMRTPDWCLAYR